ncbi:MULTISPECIES: UvrD-helicase domain-containing protein [unclassified Xanthobacter]|uniref:UvrD-helicase domain-containing protein n=1 Tax=unclassified Xanthobacter TaxID=2623496 RepID=UPI001F2E99CB|nr:MULTISPECIES: UvrD-helicase domain-containing protein [unclassified Xanthobacter]
MPLKDGETAAPRNKEWTGEQRAVIETTAPVTRVRARAGTGKTTVLRGYSAARRQVPILYIVFNKANQKAASATFPPWVRPVTSHALAFRVTGDRYRHKLGDPRAVHVARMFNIRNDTAAQAIQVLTRFLCWPGQSVASCARGRKQMDAAVYAERLWELMLDPENRDVPMPHDGYLKLFDMERHSVGRYEHILFDEAQDANPITISILQRQELPLVLVGDEYQSIYGFRGAANALDMFTGADLALTQSWRFGPEIAAAANAVLAEFGEQRCVTGRGGPSEVHAEGTPEGPYTFLSRTNAGVIEHAIERAGAPLHFVGGLESYRLERILDAFYLFMRQFHLVEDREFKAFQSFGSLADYAQEIDDTEIKAIVNLVAGYGATTADRLNELRRRSVEAQRAEVTLTTMHRAKGLEWDVVVLGETFSYADYLEERPEARITKYREDLNLLYVSATRARRRLFLNSTLYNFMK